VSNLCVCVINRCTAAMACTLIDVPRHAIAATAHLWGRTINVGEPIITRRGVFDFTGTSAPATDSCIRPRSSGTVRVHDARF